MAKNIITFENLSKLPIIHGFSWGREAENMSEGFDDPSIIQGRVANFLNSLNISSNLPIVRISPDNVSFHDPDILELSKEILKRKLSDAGEIEVGANAIFTKEKDIVLTVKPADCAICIVYAETQEGEIYIGLIHCSAWTTDKLLPLNAIEYLLKVKLTNRAKIKIGITPAISQDFFYVSKKDINLSNWGGFLKEEDGKIFIDIVGNVTKQLKEAGVPENNIETSLVDTFAHAMEGNTFSHRLSRDENFPEGRYIVAVKLK